MSADALAPLYEALAKLSFPWCEGCADCCAMPWVLEAEVPALAREPGVRIEMQQGVSFLSDERRCACLQTGRCTIYARRPLDCRLFPLDIIEQDGDYWWCIFLSCREPEALASVLVPMIPRLESLLTPGIIAEYQRQIAVTRASYAPYREGRYRLVRPLRLPTSHDLDSVIRRGADHAVGTTGAGLDVGAGLHGSLLLGVACPVVGTSGGIASAVPGDIES